MIGMWMVGAVSIVVGFAAGWVLRQFLGNRKVQYATDSAESLLADARAEAENYKREKMLEAKEELFQARQELEVEAKNRREELQRLEKMLTERELSLDSKVDILNKKEQQLQQHDQAIRVKNEDLAKRQSELERLLEEENARLQQISGLSPEEARKIQMQNILEKAKADTAHEIQEIREQTRKRAAEESREIMIQALQRCSIAHVVEATVSAVELPDDEMKGRIIGREGRNIRAFERAAGVEVLIDDTPKTVILSGFDPIRREVARQSLEKLIYDGRIHPGRIEEVVNKSFEEIEEHIFETGEQTLQDLGVHGVHHELIKMLGKQKFRLSYGQNLLQHSIEVASLAGEMASLLNLDSTLARRAGVLHDIGRTAEDYGNAPFYELGVDLAKKFGENEKIQNVIAAQAPGFDENEAITPVAIFVRIANEISVSRPGAKKDPLDKYMKRMRQLEETANSFPGVVTSYAIQAGRELRVIVEHAIVDDNKAQSLADNIVNRLRKEMEFPGQIRVSVIREYRSVDYAK